MAKTKERNGNTKFGLELIESMREALDYKQGRGPARVTRFKRLDPPPKYGSRRVLALRNRLGLTQSQFANVLNVSRKTVESWEQGARKPSEMASRLLEVIETPSWLGRLQMTA